MNLVDSSGWLEYFADGPNADFFACPAAGRDLGSWRKKRELHPERRFTTRAESSLRRQAVLRPCLTALFG